MTNADNSEFRAGMLLGVVLSVIPSLILGSWLTKLDFRDAAIKAKVGEYDSQTGHFKWVKTYNIVDEESSIED